MTAEDLRAFTARFTIAGRDQTKLIAGLAKQVALVQALLRDAAFETSVRGALCFVGADLPLLGTLTIGGYPLLYAKALAKRLNAAGPFHSEQIDRLAQVLAQRLPPA